MNKQITFTYDGKEYTLEYTRNTVRQMERQGFVAEDVEQKPMVALDLFKGAFIKHHPSVSDERKETIYDALEGKKELITALFEMYADTVKTLMAEPEKGKNVKWTPNWRKEEA